MKLENKDLLNIPDKRISSFIERLDSIVKKSKSIRNFARITAISEATIRQYLNAKSEPKMKHLIAIANAGNVSIDWLATGTVSDKVIEYKDVTVSPALSPELAKWIDIFNVINKTDQNTAISNIINKGFKTLLVDIDNKPLEISANNIKELTAELIKKLNYEDLTEVINIARTAVVAKALENDPKTKTA